MALLKPEVGFPKMEERDVVSIIEILWLYWSQYDYFTGVVEITAGFHNRNIMALLKRIWYIYISHGWYKFP